MEKISKRLIDMTEDELRNEIKEAMKELLPQLQVLDRFINENRALKLMNIGKTQLYHLRKNGKIAYVQDEAHPKKILYDQTSIMKYLETNLKKAF